jgi:hypothetical protein
MLGSWLTWPLTRRRIFLPPRLRPGRRLRQKSWPATSCSPCWTGLAARDFADVYVLAYRSGKDVLLARGAQIDPGFDANVLAGMFATLDRFTDDEIPVPRSSSAAELRTFYSTWRSELAG